MSKKNVVFFITGGIAVYKAASLVRIFVKNGYNVRVVMSDSAQKFVTPLTFEALTHTKVITDIFNNDTEFIPHVELANWADFAVVLPATANVVGKMANGIADDTVSTCLLAIDKPKYVILAMNDKMYENPATQRNIETLVADGIKVMEPKVGLLAEGYEAKGRMPEPDEIFQWIKKCNIQRNDLKGKVITISAGSTIEPIDPVRYLTNHSSGKMGFELAKVAANRGATVNLVSGPTKLTPPQNVNFVDIKTTTDMKDTMLNLLPKSDVVIMAAAVSDYRVKEISNKKIKKDGESLQLTLVQNPDILKELGHKKGKGQIIIGFAAETNNLENYAKGKLKSKNADFIVANDVSRKDIGFGTDENEVIIFGQNDFKQKISKVSKEIIAEKIFDVLSMKGE